MTKQEFIEYVKFFSNMTLEEEMQYVYDTHLEINDVSGMYHSLDEINDYSKEIRFFQCDDLSVLTTAKMPDVRFFVFVMIGKINNGFVGTCYCITERILEKIARKETCIEREIVNLCISKEQLDRMQELV